MKQIITLLFVLFTTVSFAQDELIFNNCGADQLVENINNYDAEFESYYQTQLELKSKSPVSYYIPVVFHIIHAGEPIGVGSNVSDTEIYNLLKSVNNHFKNVHNHPNNSNSNIQFVLATKSPNGACSTGINRIDYSSNQTYVNHGTQYDTSNNGVPATTIRSLSNWNPSQYYNIWVVNKITSSSNVAAYAYLSSSHGQTYDGTFLSYPYAYESTSGVLAHELGHALNLYHTFQGSNGTNCPTAVNGCGSDGDCVQDTPPHIKNHSIDLILNALNNCTGTNNSTFKNNYMTYTSNSYRQVFTPMQIVRMQSAINHYRSSHLPANNAAVFQMNQAPTVDFLINDKSSHLKQRFCEGTTISLKNISSCFLNTFNNTTVPNYTSFWTVSRNGQTVFTSSDNNPEITFTQSGNYSITLLASNNIGSRHLVRMDIIEIVPSNPVNYCTPTSLNVGYYSMAINKVMIHQINNSTAIGINAGYSDFSCTQITPALSTGPNKIEVAVSNNNPQVTDNYYVEGYIDYNKNGTFESNELIFSEIVPPNTNNQMFTFYFTPPTNVPMKELLRMRIFSDRYNISNTKLNCGAQFNIGDVEDYGVYFVSNLSTENTEYTNLKFYPNPVKDLLNIETNAFENANIEIYSMSGQLIKSIKSDSQHIQIDVSKLSSGTYILKIDNNSQKFIKE